jgi:micrococcal nuclease
MKLFRYIKTLIAVSLLSVQIVAPVASAQTQVIELPPGEDATVTRVIDGDTVEVRIANERFSLRYIGVDSAEINRKPLQCFAKEAQAFNRQLVLNKPVRLEKDINETDKFGRLLRYVYLQDGRMVNAELVKSGYAQAITYPPDVKYAEQFAALQTQARETGAGLWTKCAQPAPAPTVTLSLRPQPLAAAPNP